MQRHLSVCVKKLNTTNHRWQRSILGISWKDRVTNKEMRARTGHHSMEDILSARRLNWFGHVILIRTDHQRIPQQSLHWNVLGFKRDPGHPRTNWRSTVSRDLLTRGVRLAKNDFGSVFVSVSQKTAVFGSVSDLLN